jgi:peptide/nickel transport system ATP-binding protein
MLRVEGLRVVYPGPPRHIAVGGVSFAVPARTAVGLVGESGSGKSTIAKAIVGLTPVEAGGVWLDDRLIVDHTTRPTKIRDRIQYVHQDATASLNPRMRVGETLAETAAVADGGRVRSHRKRVDELLNLVGLAPAQGDRFPHQLSGGQRQRVAIARALATRATTLLLDEVTSALDVSVQATVLNVLNGLRDELGLSLLVISHDLAVVRVLCDEVVVLQGGEVCESGPAGRVLDEPQHPYTAALVAAVPSLTHEIGADR